jgi:heat induced stress protein YflT
VESITKAGYGQRRLVASYGSYAEAQGAVDRLADGGFPVERVSIVAEGLRFEERVTGRKGYGRAALEGSGAGAIPGALIGFVFGLFSSIDPLVSGLLLALYGLSFGAVLGATLSLISDASSGGRRDFSSVGSMRADSYDVVADEEVAEEASRLLAERS